MSGKRSLLSRFYILPFFVLVLFIFSVVGVFADDFNDFSFRLPSAVSSDSSNKVISHDFDGDSDIDLFLANDGQNRLLLNDGTGVFTDATSGIPVDTAKSRGVAVGDIDGDSDDDIFVANFDDANAVLLNDGSGVFSDATSTWFSVGGMFSVTAVLGDIDGDTDLDLIVGNSTPLAADAIKIYENTGSSFNDVTSTWITSAQAKYVQKVILSDVNGDSLPDLIAICSFETQNRLYINNSGTSFTDSTSANFPSSAKSSSSAALGDVDGDSDLDLFVVNEGGSSSRLLINDGSGVFSDVTGTQYPVDTNHSNDAVFGDIDGDSDLDIIVANGSTKIVNNVLVNDSSKGENVIFLNNGSGTFTKASSTVFADKLKYNSTGVAVIDASGKPFNILFSNGNTDGVVLYSKESASLFSVSGTVDFSGGCSSVTDVTITLSGINDSVLSTTNPLSDGSYSFSSLQGGSSFTLTPSLSGYESDPLVITVTAIAADLTGKDFTVTSTANGPAPKITKFKPKKIKPFKLLKITGNNFTGTKGSVMFTSKGNADGVDGKVTKWSNKLIKVKVPFGADKGKVTVKNDDNQTVSKTLKITPIKPVIKKVAKTITAGKKVTIKGSSFGDSQADGELLIGGASAEVTKWGNTKITAVVPDITGKTAKVVVKTHYGSKSKKVKVK